MIIDKTLKNDVHVASAWLVFGAARLSWIDEKFIKEFPNRPSYGYSFSEELFARNTLLDYWTSLNPQLLIITRTRQRAPKPLQ